MLQNANLLYIKYLLLFLIHSVSSISPVGHHAEMFAFNRAKGTLAKSFSLDAVIWESRIASVSMPMAGAKHSIKINTKCCVIQLKQD